MFYGYFKLKIIAALGIFALSLDEIITSTENCVNEYNNDPKNLLCVNGGGTRFTCTGECYIRTSQGFGIGAFFGLSFVNCIQNKTTQKNPIIADHFVADNQNKLIYVYKAHQFIGTRKVDLQGTYTCSFKGNDNERNGLRPTCKVCTAR
ncbi:hypothetical protein O181_108950 [Austropuccinia psidii MF-1]|uniref:Secreted protein n=1 Tax=Austropuccinia psidii MF-1 TaxID=1389203 RepID=A0A9Q3JTE5_9BASI|nr:hypothetical protein [Austropuccinia psidii MF-1]